MFLHDFAYVAAPAEAVCARIVQDHGSWLSPLAAGAAGDGEALRVRIGPGGPVPGLSTAALAEVGTPRRRDDAVVVPLTWHASGVPGMFPALTADLEIAALGPHRTQVTLMGRYDPPLGALERRLDVRLFHRIAQATARSFLRRLAQVLEQAPAPAAGSAEAAHHRHGPR
jgi:hypothetical protein